MWRDAHVPRVSRCAYAGKPPETVGANPPSSPPCRDWPDCLAERVGFEPEDWRRTQRILDQGKWLEQPDGRRLLWIAEDGKPWTAVVKRTANDEIYLLSSRRAKRLETRKWP